MVIKTLQREENGIARQMNGKDNRPDRNERLEHLGEGKEMVRHQRTFISSKYYAMLCSGTILMVLVAIIGVADTLIAGIILGETAVAGICLALPIYSLASFFEVFFSYGVPILYAGKIGAFQKEEADRCFGVGLTVNLVIGILMFAAILCGGDSFLQAYHPDNQVYVCASDYLVWMKYAVLLMPLTSLLDGMLFAEGDETISLVANLAKGVVKVVMSVVLCCNMGVKGLSLQKRAGRKDYEYRHIQGHDDGLAVRLFHQHLRASQEP